MAALYLHNALFTTEDQPTAPPLRHATSSHLRNSSSVSSVTLQTTTSRPTDPLLCTIPARLSPRLPAHSDGVQVNSGSDPQRDSTFTVEWDGYWENIFNRRLKTLRLWRRLLLTILSAWALFNSIRYFLSFPQFISQERQLFALFLGASTTLSLALVIASLSFGLLSTTVDDFPESHGAINILKRIILPYLASWFLLAPSIVNLVLVFIWKRSPDSQKTLQGRCGWDIDVVWSGIGMRCTAPGSSPPWLPWLMGAIFRFVFTLCFLALYHIVCYRYETIRRPARESPYTRFRSQRPHHQLNSLVAKANPNIASGQTSTPVTTMINAPPAAHRHKYHRSLPTVADVEYGSPSTPPMDRSEPSQRLQQRTPKLTPPHSHNGSPVIIPGELSGTLAGPSASSEESASAETSTGDGGIPCCRPGSGSNDTGLHGFANRFRAVVDQISKDTEDGLNLASPESHTNHQPQRADSPLSFADDEEEYNPYDEAPEASSSSHDGDGDWHYNEYGQPVFRDRPDNDEARVEVFGRIIHRMPTIESLGSREHNSLATPSISLRYMETELPTRSSTTSDRDAPGSPVSRGRRSGSLDATSRVPSRQAFRAAGEVLIPSELGELVPHPIRASPDPSSTGRSGGETSTATRSSGNTTVNTFYSATDSPVHAEP